MSEAVERLARAHYLKTTEVVSVIRPGAPFLKWEELPEEQRRLSLSAMRAALTELSAMGLVVVPREPTPEMQNAADAAWADLNAPFHTQAARMWSAMLNASKVQP